MFYDDDHRQNQEKEMKHLGDITKIHGYDIETVDVICGGSPCQDLSVAGLRKGIQHSALGDEETTRSGLFMDQVRIVKEMRYPEEFGRADRMVRRSDGIIRKPRYMVWENVPGAFTSKGGADFAAVLEEIVKVEVRVPVHIDVPSGGWSKAGAICDQEGRYSIAWRVHDAQFWGVPQRRKRVCVLADFDGISAPDILFGSEHKRVSYGADGVKAVSDPRRECGREVLPESESMSRNPDESIEERQGSSGEAEASSDGTVFCIEGNGSRESHHGDGYIESEIMYTLNTVEHHAVALENHPNDSRMTISGDVVQTLSSRMGTGGNNTPMVLENDIRN